MLILEKIVALLLGLFTITNGVVNIYLITNGYGIIRGFKTTRFLPIDKKLRKHKIISFLLAKIYLGNVVQVIVPSKASSWNKLMLLLFTAIYFAFGVLFILALLLL